jgi:uncharacterized protein DUF6843
MQTFRNRKKGKHKFFTVLVLVFSLLSLCCEERRTPNAYELPKNFSGWVTIRYEKPNAPALEKIDGFYLLRVNHSGIFETSSKVAIGMASDEYYWYDGEQKIILPQSSDSNTTRIHAHTYGSADVTNFVRTDTLPVGVEVELYDGSKYTRLDDKGGMSYKSGRFLLEHFYVSAKMEGYWDFNPPAMPDNHSKW